MRPCHFFGLVAGFREGGRLCFANVYLFAQGARYTIENICGGA